MIYKYKAWVMSYTLEQTDDRFTNVYLHLKIDNKKDGKPVFFLVGDEIELNQYDEK